MEPEKATKAMRTKKYPHPLQSETARIYASAARKAARPVTRFWILAFDGVAIGVDPDAARLAARNAASWAARARDAENRYLTTYAPAFVIGGLNSDGRAICFAAVGGGDL